MDETSIEIHPKLMVLARAEMTRRGLEGEPTAGLLIELGILPSPIDELLSGVGLRRWSILDVAPPPSALACLAGGALASLSPRWTEIHGFTAALREVPQGDSRRELSGFAASRALLSRGCALLLTSPTCVLSSEERVHAAVASVALAALVASNDPLGVAVMLRLSDRLLDLSMVKDLPVDVQEAAYAVGRGLLHARTPEEERLLIRKLTAQEATGEAPQSTGGLSESSVDVRPSSESPSALPSQPTEGAALTREEAARELRISTKSLDRQIKAGLLRATHCGKRVLVTRDAIRDYLERQ